MAEESMTHVWLQPCGCVACAIVNRPQTLREVAKAQRAAQKNGEEYKLLPTEAVRQMPWRCKEHKYSKPK